MKIQTLAALICIISFSCSFCASKKVATNHSKDSTDSAGPVAIIYKTNKDYSQYIPVTLSEDKKQIVAYPGTSDIYYKGTLAYPTPLDKGFNLDNRGISKNSVFVNITYEEYSKFNAAPPVKELFAKIIDFNPFLEFYTCGNRYKFKNEVEEINKLIESGISDRCKCLVGKDN